ncbi:acyl carrier protein, partial [Clavulina sp. PMI_390]
YAASAGLSKEAIQTRVVDVLKSFEKVSPEKLTTTARFAEDLGLDSLDAVEVVMAIEEVCAHSLEFSIEIPDEEADAILTVQQAIEYIAKTP